MIAHSSVYSILCIFRNWESEKRLHSVFTVYAYIAKAGLQSRSSLVNCIIRTLITNKDLNLFEKLHELGRYSKIDIEELVKRNQCCIGNSLVDVCVKEGRLTKAQEMFDTIAVKDVVTWTTLIAGYVHHQSEMESLSLFEKMQIQGVCPNAFTFSCVLKACGSVGDVRKGIEIHVEMSRKGLSEANDFLVSSLVDMYAKCGLVAYAQDIFDMVTLQDVVTWTALITGYVQLEYMEDALYYFNRMQIEGVCPNAVTFASSLKACGATKAQKKGVEIYAKITKEELMRKDFVLGNAVVDMYAKCGMLIKAKEAFDNLSYRNVVSWTALISGYADHDYGEEALNCLQEMKDSGVSPNAITYACSLKACIALGAIDKGKEIHAEVLEKGLLDNHVILGNALVDMYAKCGLLVKAQEVFDMLPVRDVVSWNALLSGYTNYDHAGEALDNFRQMEVDGISPNTVTYACILKACGTVGAVEQGKKIHEEIAKEGLLGSDIVLGSTLVDMYAKCGSFEKANEVFDALVSHDTVSWNALITGYVQHEFDEEALDCYNKMQLEDVSPNETTFSCSLKACGSSGASEKGRRIHTEVVRKGLLQQDLVIGTAVIDMYSKCGMLAMAQDVFDELAIRDIISWNSLISGYAQLGDIANVLLTFDRMIEEEMTPDSVTFISIVNACSHAGMPNMGQASFDAMNACHRIVPNLEHHACLIDLLGRAGQLDKAFVLLREMPFHPNIVMWHMVLGACMKWGDVQIGRQAFEHAVCLEHDGSAAYICMHNIYAATSMQDDD